MSDQGVRQAAQSQVYNIQSLYNQGKINDIYGATTDEFKEETSKDVFILMMKKKNMILGRFSQSKLLSSNVINHRRVILTYRVTYQHYSLIEEFELVRANDNEKLRLNAYFIDDAGKRGEVIKL